MELIKMNRKDILGYINSVELIEKGRFLEFDTVEDSTIFRFAIDCYNTICRTHIARMGNFPAFDLPEELGVDKGSEKVYFAVYVIEPTHYGALVSEKDLRIPELLEECLATKGIVQIDVDERLKPLCYTLGFAKDVKVYNNPGNKGFYFSFKKVKSTYQKIKDAVEAKHRKMSFHFDEVKEYTVRSYATRLKKEIGISSRVKVSGKITTLYFGGETNLDLAEPDLRQLIYTYNGLISRADWELLFREMMEECFEKQLPEVVSLVPEIVEELPPIAEWERLGYDSEEEWSDRMKEKAEAANDDWNKSEQEDAWTDDEW